MYNKPHTKKIKYTKFLNVRHPVEKLYSAWSQKFSKTHRNVNFYVKRYIQNGLIQLNHPAPENYTCSFIDFIEYWLNHKEKKYDYHWHSQVRHGMPCNLEYDIITKTETADWQEF